MNGRVERAVGAWVLAVALAACSSFEPPRSTTPRITDDPNASRDESLLLTEADVRAVGGLENATARDLADAGAFQNPDPRGPCGAKVSEPPATGQYGRAFTGEGAMLVHMVQPVSAATSTYVDAMKADARQGCGPFSSRTNEGRIQQVSDIVPVDVPGCDRCAASTAKVTVGDQHIFVGLLVYEVAGRYGAVQVMGEAPVPAAALVHLFRRAAARLPG